MREATGKNGTIYYHSEDVNAEIEKLKNTIADLELSVTRLTNSNRGGNVANLTPREPIYDEDIQMKIASRVASGESKRSLSKEYNVSRGTILNYCNKFAHKYGFVKSLNSYEKAELLARFGKGESITELREPLAIDSPKIPDNLIREVIAEKYGVDLFCSRCQLITMHAPRVRGGRESCIVCGTIVPETTNTDMSTDNFDIDNFEFKFTNEDDGAETSQNAPQSFLGGIPTPTGTNHSQTSQESSQALKTSNVFGSSSEEIDDLLGIKMGGQTNIMGDAPKTGAEKALERFGIPEKKISSDPLAGDGFDNAKSKFGMISPDFRKRD